MENHSDSSCEVSSESCRSSWSTDLWLTDESIQPRQRFGSISDSEAGLLVRVDPDDELSEWPGYGKVMAHHPHAGANNLRAKRIMPTKGPGSKKSRWHEPAMDYDHLPLISMDDPLVKELVSETCIDAHKNTKNLRAADEASERLMCSGSHSSIAGKKAGATEYDHLPILSVDDSRVKELMAESCNDAHKNTAHLSSAADEAADCLALDGGCNCIAVTKPSRSSRHLTSALEYSKMMVSQTDCSCEGSLESGGSWKGSLQSCGLPSSCESWLMRQSNERRPRFGEISDSEARLLDGVFKDAVLSECPWDGKATVPHPHKRPNYQRANTIITKSVGSNKPTDYDHLPLVSVDDPLAKELLAEIRSDGHKNSTSLHAANDAADCVVFSGRGNHMADKKPRLQFESHYSDASTVYNASPGFAWTSESKWSSEAQWCSEEQWSSECTRGQCL